MLASVRLRAGVALRHFKDEDCTAGDILDSLPSKIIVIGKYLDDDPSRHSRWLENVKQAKCQGCKAILDYTDHHLFHAVRTTHSILTIKDQPTLLKQEAARRDFYAKLVPLIDVAVCSSENLKCKLEKYFPGPVVVIEDAIDDYPILQPASALSTPLTGLFFGHGTNISYLFRDFLFKIDRPLRIVVLTNEDMLPAFQQRIASRHVRVPTNIDIEFAGWSLKAMVAATNISNFCLIPSDPDDPRKSGASANRLITAFALGLPTCADMIESYRPYKDFFVDIRSNEFLEFIHNPIAYASMVIQAQKDIVPLFRKDVIEQKWSDLFESL